MMEAIQTSEMSVYFCKTTWHHIIEGCHFSYSPLSELEIWLLCLFEYDKFIPQQSNFCQETVCVITDMPFGACGWNNHELLTEVTTFCVLQLNLVTQLSYKNCEHTDRHIQQLTEIISMHPLWYRLKEGDITLSNENTEVFGQKRSITHSIHLKQEVLQVYTHLAYSFILNHFCSICQLRRIIMYLRRVHSKESKYEICGSKVKLYHKRRLISTVKRNILLHVL